MKKQTTKSKPVNVYHDHVAGVQYSDYQLISIKADDLVNDAVIITDKLIARINETQK